MAETQKGIPLSIFILVGVILFLASAVSSYSIFTLTKVNPLKVAQTDDTPDPGKVRNHLPILFLPKRKKG